MGTMDTTPTKIVVVGAGPVGSLAALYAAQRGYQVELYELRPDLRDPSTEPLNFTKSINVAVSERGINALRYAGIPGLEADVVLNTSLAMRGRMIHGRTSAGELYHDSQDYDIHGRCIYAADRSTVNRRLLEVLGTLSNVRIVFNHKLTGVDFRARRAWFEVQSRSHAVTTGPRPRSPEIDVPFDLLIGADGAHSAARYHLMKFCRMDYQQEYIDTLWCEFFMAPRQAASTGETGHQISPQHLHIWPAGDSMFIAIPNEDGSFTCTLFLPSRQFATLEHDPGQVPSFFDAHFPGVTLHIPPEQLVKMFEANPHLPLISVKCRPHHFGSTGVIIGDAAHAMVPFYGQGMNAGLEDVRVLFSALDKYARIEDNRVLAAKARELALSEYTASRVEDAAAINDLALQNYMEMRASVLSPTYRLRKYLEEILSKYVPSLGWQTKYSRVSFGNERYSEVVTKSEFQSRMLFRGLMALVSPIAFGLPVLAWMYGSRMNTREIPEMIACYLY